MRVEVYLIWNSELFVYYLLMACCGPRIRVSISDWKMCRLSMFASNVQLVSAAICWQYSRPDSRVMLVIFAYFLEMK